MREKTQTEAVLGDFLLDLGEEDEEGMGRAMHMWLQAHPLAAVALVTELKVLVPWYPDGSGSAARITGPVGQILATSRVVLAQIVPDRSRNNLWRWEIVTALVPDNDKRMGTAASFADADAAVRRALGPTGWTMASGEETTAFRQRRYRGDAGGENAFNLLYGSPAGASGPVSTPPPTPDQQEETSRLLDRIAERAREQQEAIDQAQRDEDDARLRAAAARLQALHMDRANDILTRLLSGVGNRKNDALYRAQMAEYRAIVRRTVAGLTPGEELAQQEEAARALSRASVALDRMEVQLDRAGDPFAPLEGLTARMEELSERAGDLATRAGDFMVEGGEMIVRSHIRVRSSTGWLWGAPAKIRAKVGTWTRARWNGFKVLIGGHRD